jgi:hypothetical protein
MRAHIITTITRPRRSARRHVVALVLGVCALAIPATASAFGGPSGADRAEPQGAVGPLNGTSQGPHGADYLSVSENPPIALRRDGLQAEPTVVSASPSDSSDGFDWGDAAVGAGAAMALIAISAAVLSTIRRRPGGLPSASTG